MIVSIYVEIRCYSTETSEGISSLRQGSSPEKALPIDRVVHWVVCHWSVRRCWIWFTETFSIDDIVLYSAASEQMPWAANSTGHIKTHDLHQMICLVIARARQNMYIERGHCMFDCCVNSIHSNVSFFIQSRCYVDRNASALLTDAYRE